MNCVSIGSHNGLSPVRRQAIIWTNAGLLSIGSLGTIFSEILIKIQNFSFIKMHLKISSAKWRPFCPERDELSCDTSQLGSIANIKENWNCKSTLIIHASWFNYKSWEHRNWQEGECNDAYGTKYKLARKLQYTPHNIHMVCLCFISKWLHR